MDRSKNEDAIANTIANLLEKPDEQPANLKPLFNRVARIQATGQHTERAITETKHSLNELLNQRAKIMGSAEILYDLIKEQIPEELIKRYGDKLLTQEPSGLPENTEAKR